MTPTVGTSPEISFINVETPPHIAQVSRLAETIWTEHFVPLIGRDQVEYMLTRFQSEDAIARQISQGFRYIIITRSDMPVGYAATVHPPRANDMQLSKFYVARGHRGQGVGRRTLAFIEQAGRDANATTIWLTVNKHNTTAIRAYEKLGFENRGGIVQDIGAGFVMDDFRMSKVL